MKLNKWNDFRNRVVSFLIHSFGPINAWLLRANPPEFTIEELLQLDSKSLGKKTALQLKKLGYNFIEHYESHDFKHVLLNYSMDALGEVRMQFFAIGNGNYFPPTWLICAFGAMAFPSKWKLFKQDFQRGQNSSDLTHVKWNYWIRMPIHVVREKLLAKN